MASHEPACATHSGGACTCIVLEEALIVAASRPSPAELIRRAKARGLIQSAVAYVGPLK